VGRPGNAVGIAGEEQKEIKQGVDSLVRDKRREKKRKEEELVAGVTP
jgi:hypothetical protein